MASTDTPEKTKGTLKKRPTARHTGPKPSSRSPGRSSGGESQSSPPESQKFPFLPLAALWLLAVVALAGLIYWGEDSKTLLPMIQSKLRSAAFTNADRPAGTQKRNLPQEPSKPKPADQQQPSHQQPNHVQSSETDGPPRTPTIVEHPIPRDTSPSQPQTKQSEAQKPNESQVVALNTPLTHPENVPPPVPTHPHTPALMPPLARVAIVIDDFGEDLEMTKRFLALPFQVTFSVIPYLRHSREISELVHAQHHEVMLHLPMEPRGYPGINPGSGALLLSMSADQIHKTVQTALDANPHISGMNNHMGSRFTEDSTYMRIVLTELHRRNLFFLDSFTTPRSAGLSVARELRLPSTRRDIFLDNSPSASSIRSQIDQLIRKARIQGNAVAIGHPHEATLKALMQAAGRFEKEKIAIVPVRELLVEPAAEAGGR